MICSELLANFGSSGNHSVKFVVDFLLTYQRITSVGLSELEFVSVGTSSAALTSSAVSAFLVVSTDPIAVA
jgi:hypothetical protein